jgi:hypothetical protein
MSLHQVELTGGINTDPAIIRDQIYANIRRQLPQAKPHALNGQEVAIVGGGPSLLSTFNELRELAFRGVKLVALNNAAAWLLERNLRPSMHILLDARASNARFITPPIPQCKYFVASQCHPDLFDAVDGRDVTIWHAVSEEDEPVLKDWYDGYYHIVGGGTTVALRALALLRMCGFFRMHLFGVDSCVSPVGHHAYPQPENDTDAVVRVYLVPTDPVTGEKRFDLKRGFDCTSWHLKQAEEFETTIRAMGDAFQLQVHGDGLLATMLQLGAELVKDTNEAD